MRVIPKELAEATERLKLVYEKMIEGEPEKQIAQALKVSPHTVHSHIKRIYRHLNVTSRPMLLAVVNKRLQERLRHLEGKPSEDVTTIIL